MLFGHESNAANCGTRKGLVAKCVPIGTQTYRFAKLPFNSNLNNDGICLRILPFKSPKFKSSKSSLSLFAKSCGARGAM